MKCYQLRIDQLYNEDIGRYMSYGIDIYEGGAIIRTIKDVSLKKEPLLKLIHLLNKLQPDLNHFDDIIEDFIS